jgi:sugar lactone lactonase YvrE
VRALVFALALLVPYSVRCQTRVVTNDAPVAANCSIRLIEDLRLGVEDHPVQQSFGAILSLAIAPDGTMFVLDPTAFSLSKFSPSGVFLRQIGAKGRGPGEFESPYRVIATNTRVFVYDRALGRIVAFTTDGKAITEALVPFASVSQPFMAADLDGGVYLALAPVNAKSTTPIIHHFDADLKRVGSFGTLTIPDTTDMRLLGSGPLKVDSDNKLWFAPFSGFELRRYSATGQLELTATRVNQYRYFPRPFQRIREMPGGRAQVSYDNDRALTTNLDIDPHRNIWYFTRDVPGKHSVIDVFSREGKYLEHYEFPLDRGPSKLDAAGRLYAVTSERGYPQVVRYRVQHLATDRRSACASVR